MRWRPKLPADVLPTLSRLRQAVLGGDGVLIPVAAVIGILAGLAAVGFDWLVENCRWVSFGLLEAAVNPVLQLVLILLLPALGGLIVGCVQWFLLRQTQRAHGVPTVIEALSRKGGAIPARVGAARAVTASITIGSGGSAGVEGPIITIGSAVASNVARLLRLPRQHMSTLVGCGAAAATAAIFNAPIAGVIFVLEVLLRDFSVRTFVPIILSSVFAVAVTQSLLGENQAVFNLPEAMEHYEVVLTEMPAYAVLGVLAGLVGAMFVVALPFAERQWDKVNVRPWLKPALGGLLLGVLGVGFTLTIGQPMPAYEAPVFFSNGYPVIEATMNPDNYTAFGDGVINTTTMPVTLTLLTAALALKLVGTCLTIGSGGAGGVIAPSLFMGAMMGAAVGVVAMSVEWLGVSTPATYALAGMAGVIAAVAHCPLAAFLLVFEITADYKVILPMMLVAILATSTAQLIARDSLYAYWLSLRGIRLGTYSDLTLLRRMTVREVPLSPAVIVQHDDPATRLIELAQDFAAVDYVVCDEQEVYEGMVVGEDVRRTLVHHHAAALLIVAELMRSNLATVRMDETLDAVLDKFARHEVSSLPVVDAGGRVKGVITRNRLMQQYQQALAKRG